MENMNQNTSGEIIKIDQSCLKEVHIEKDMESSFRYFNLHFVWIGILLMIIFGIQYYYGFPEGENIDMANFTYKYSNYQAWGNIFWIFTAMFLHWSFGHILSNLIFLYPFTLITSLILRHYIYLSVISITGVTAGIGSYILNDLPSLGASWWIFWIFWFIVPYYLLNKSKLSENVHDIPWVFLCMATYIIYQW